VTGVQTCALPIFCGSSSGANPIFTKVTKQLATLLAEKNITMVFGGGSVGLMGALADQTIASNGVSIGVIPEKLQDLELGHPDITKMYVVDSMHTRKEKMAELSDAFVALAGGMGTIEEITEMFTLTQLGYFQKPCILLNTNGFYDHFIAFMDAMVEHKFLKKAHREMMLIANTPEEVISFLENHQVNYIPKWQ